MANVINRFEILSTRSGFNSAVRHVKGTIELVDALASKKNLSDLLQERASTEEIGAERVSALLRMLLLDKLGYRAISRNLNSTADSLDALAQEFSKWNAVDLVLSYHHPDLGLLIANPKSAEQLSAFGVLRKRELAIAYAGRFEKGADDLCAKAASLALDMLEGATPKIPEDFYKGEYARKAEPKAKAATAKIKAGPGRKPKKEEVQADAKAIAPTAATSVTAAKPVSAAPVSAPKVPSRMTPMYSVTVQNELFHNGNVEAWKRIIASYNARHPNLEVLVYYDGERITNLNALFKWGKVKHGSTIQFAVAGNDIQNVAKLQRYLIQGASHQFEAFLHGPVHNTLNLF
ncbi:MAG: hypothetical protein A2Z99_11385 [Treponema sp. GWB1_62_6]|nr:MAG: hypothetical protein A2001_07790 [Treponema sp. GWC1_61_84]OHE67986.1 MAG: hypothetical protein A2413_14260 [Treponema sp. RIFOXYC1_FULL_61_9]OHE70105.1 MAG: hypothetical protein A2Z99_11385 [Treponema sp. GWB1_62_6]HCM25508.1 hypothetical protein [Treponema sp.]